MKLDIHVEGKNIEIMLKKDRKVVDGMLFLDEHDLTEKLLPAIDEILKRNKSEINDVKKARVFSSDPDSYTTSRIARAVANVINWNGCMKGG